MDALPIECQAHILNYAIDNRQSFHFIELVCKLWRALAEEMKFETIPFFWEERNVSPFYPPQWKIGKTFRQNLQIFPLKTFEFSLDEIKDENLIIRSIYLPNQRRNISYFLLKSGLFKKKIKDYSSGKSIETTILDLKKIDCKQENTMCHGKIRKIDFNFFDAYASGEYKFVGEGEELLAFKKNKKSEKSVIKIIDILTETIIQDIKVNKCKVILYYPMLYVQDPNKISIYKFSSNQKIFQLLKEIIFKDHYDLNFYGNNQYLAILTEKIISNEFEDYAAGDRFYVFDLATLTLYFEESKIEVIGCFIIWNQYLVYTNSPCFFQEKSLILVDLHTKQRKVFSFNELIKKIKGIEDIGLIEHIDLSSLRIDKEDSEKLELFFTCRLKSETYSIIAKSTVLKADFS